MEYIDRIFFRKINPSDFKKLYDIDKPESGGGQTYLEAAGISNDSIVDFLNYAEISDSPLDGENRSIYTFYAHVLGDSSQASFIEFAPRKGRSNYRISRQNMKYKHPAWSLENGFPEPLKDNDGNYTSEGNFEGIIDNLLITIFRTTYKKYYAGFINISELPESWPSDIGLNVLFEGERRGVLRMEEKSVEFVDSLSNPFGNVIDTPVAVQVGLDEKAYENDVLTPEWFNENGQAFLYLDEEAADEREKFLKKYAPDVLRGLDGLTLLRTIFLNDENKDNLCYELEFDAKLRELFGSIKSGTAYKYGLHFSKKNQKWATGTGRNPQFLSVDEAIELGTQIRDYLVDGADVLTKYDSIDSLEDYSNLYKELNEATDGFINRVWFLKYYQMVAPELFPPIYSQNAQATVIKAIGEKPDDNSIVRMGQMQLFIRQCDVSPVVFSRTFWSNYDRSDDAEEDGETTTTSAPIKYATGFDSPYARNRIVFGAPGTGKSFTINNERKELIGEDNETDYERVTFHPDYSYANFVGTYKPVPGHEDENGVDTIAYKYVPGPFMRVYVEALKNGRTDNPKPFLLIIEEINRANVAAVFGDIFQLLDRGDDNVSEYPIQASEDIKKYLSEELNLDPEECSKIKIPDNMFIWATMNSADQGVFPMDTAFKRRWDFTYLGIDDNDEDIRGKYVVVGSKEQQRIEWNELRKAINEFLASEKINEDKQLGPYFIARGIVVPADGGDEIDSKRFCDVFKHKVLMYLFDDAGKQKRGKLFEGSAKGQNRYSKICEAFDEQGIGIFHGDIQANVKVQDLKTNGYDLDENGMVKSEE